MGFDNPKNNHVFVCLLNAIILNIKLKTYSKTNIYVLNYNNCQSQHKSFSCDIIIS